MLLMRMPIKENGVVITNNHVIANADDILVKVDRASMYNSVESRATNLGRLIFSDAAEGFTSERTMAIEDFDTLL